MHRGGAPPEKIRTNYSRKVREIKIGNKTKHSWRVGPNMYTITFTPEMNRKYQKLVEITKVNHHDGGDWVDRVKAGGSGETCKTDELGESG